MIEQWQELKETITEMRDNGGTGTQQEVCKFLANYMEILEKQMQQPCEDAISREAVLEQIDDWRKNEFLRVTNPLHYLCKRINSLPSVASQLKVESEEENERNSKCNPQYNIPIF